MSLLGVPVRELFYAAFVGMLFGVLGYFTARRLGMNK